jgi:membrane associated rhomboid family serine protease
MQRVQYSLSTLLIVMTVAAILCSLVKVAANFIPLEVGEFLALTVAVSAVPAALIGRRSGRTFESLYLGITWGVILATVVCVPEIVSAFLPFSLPSSMMYLALKAAAGAAIGGCFGAGVMWLIEKSQQRIVRDESRTEKERD